MNLSTDRGGSVQPRPLAWTDWDYAVSATTSRCVNHSMHHQQDSKGRLGSEMRLTESPSPSVMVYESIR